MKLVQMEQGKRQVMAEGTLEDIVRWLLDNPDETDWAHDEDPEIEVPDFSDIETVRDLQLELDKVDLTWWSLVIE
jgi:hypothetical protein